MFSRGCYAVVSTLQVLLLATCASRTGAAPDPATAETISKAMSAKPSSPSAVGASSDNQPQSITHTSSCCSRADPPASTSHTFPAESNPLQHFRAALTRTRETQTKTRVLFFGDSHVAADFMSGRVRERLQAAYGDGGPGFVMTGRPWRSYRHDRAELLEAKGLKATYVRKRPATATLPLGLAGVAFAPEPVAPEAAQAAGEAALPARETPLVRLRVLNAKEPRGRATQYELLFAGSPLPHVLLDGSPIESLAPPSLTFAASDDQPHEVTITTTLDAPLTLFGLVAELEGAGVVLDTLGIPGARARAQLYWDEALFKEHLTRRKPDLWVLSYGTNESTDVTQPIKDYEGQLREVTQRMRALAPTASCLMVGPTDFPERIKKGVYQARERTSLINELQRKTAAEFGCAYFDIVENMGGPLSMLRWAKASPPLGAKDLIHLTRRGYAWLGDRIADLLLEVTTVDASPAALPTTPAPAPKQGRARSREKVRSTD